MAARRARARQRLPRQAAWRADNREDVYTTLSSLLAGLWKRSGNRPLMAVGQEVRAFEQMSAERERTLRRRSLSGRGAPSPWTPSQAANEA